MGGSGRGAGPAVIDRRYWREASEENKTGTGSHNETDAGLLTIS